MSTNSQKLAQAAYDRVQDRKPGEKYIGFARDFPALVHACGLAQAAAFAMAKQEHHLHYLDDLARVLAKVGYPEGYAAARLVLDTRTLPVPAYLRLSRDALAAADWLKRYVDAFEAPRPGPGGN